MLRFREMERVHIRVNPQTHPNTFLRKQNYKSSFTSQEKPNGCHHTLNEVIYLLTCKVQLIVSPLFSYVPMPIGSVSVVWINPLKNTYVTSLELDVSLAVRLICEISLPLGTLLKVTENDSTKSLVGNDGDVLTISRSSWLGITPPMNFQLCHQQ